MFTSTNYSFADGEASSVWKKIDLSNGDVETWADASEISEIVFVGPKDTSILYLNGTNADGDGVSLYTSDVEKPDSAKLVASLSGDFSGLKASKTKSGDIHFLLYSKAYPNGTAYSEATAVTPPSTGRLYDSIYVRHWVSFDDSPYKVSSKMQPLAKHDFFLVRIIGCPTSSKPSLAAVSRRAQRTLSSPSRAT